MTLIKNVNTFDGTSENLLEGYDVLVVRNPIKGIEHGHLLDEEVAKEIAKNGAWMCVQPFTRDMPGAEEALGPEKLKIFLQLAEGFPKTMDLVKKYKIKFAYGTDFSFTPDHNDFVARRVPGFLKAPLIFCGTMVTPC